MTHETSDEIVVRAAVERLLAAMGSYDVDALREMFTTDANIGAVAMNLGAGYWIPDEGGG